jgi:hypothetical protein
MAAEAFKEQKANIVFSPPVQLTNEFYKETSAKNLQEAAGVLLNAHQNLFHAGDTPMRKKLLFIKENPDKVVDGEAMFGVSPTKKKGDAIYSVKITENGKEKDKRSNVFLLYVSDRETSLSYFSNNELMEMHLHKEGQISHDIRA